MRLSRREMIMGMVMIWVVLAAVYYYLVYNPTEQEIDRLVQTNNQLEQEKTGINKGAVPAFNEVSLRLEYQELLKQIPELAYFPEILSSVNAAADQTGSQLIAVNYGQNSGQGQNPADPTSITPDNKKPMPYETIPVEFVVRGDYGRLKSFVKAIEGSTRILTVSNVQIVAAQKKQEPTPDGAGEILPSGDENNLKTEPIAEPEPATPLAGSAVYDPYNLTMTIKTTAYYNAKSLKGLSGAVDSVEPSKDSKENPFNM